MQLNASGSSIGAYFCMLASWWLSTKDSPTKATAAMIVPMRMKGVRRPIFPLCLSEIAPKRGSINSARMLSSAMITPEAVCDRPNLFVRIRGIVLS